MQLTKFPPLVFICFLYYHLENQFYSYRDLMAVVKSRLLTVVTTNNPLVSYFGDANASLFVLTTVM